MMKFCQVSDDECTEKAPGDQSPGSKRKQAEAGYSDFQGA